MENKICDSCGTENEPQYKFCKNCGKALEESEQTNVIADESSKSRFDEGTYSRNSYCKSAEAFEGISTEEMSVFIGKNSDEIISKFAKMEITKSKTSWNWPAAILGFLFGPLGSALWFFYRKMKKPAIILTLIGIAVTFATGIMVMLSGDVESVLSSLDFSNADKFAQQLKELGGKVSVAQFVLYEMATLINSIAGCVAGIISGLYGLGIYKKHCINKINEYRLSKCEKQFYNFGLSTLGGTSSGMLAVGIFIIIGCEGVLGLMQFLFEFYKFVV